MRKDQEGWVKQPNRFVQFIKNKTHYHLSKVRLFKDFLCVTTYREYLERKNDANLSILNHFVAEVVDEVTINLLIGLGITSTLWVYHLSQWSLLLVLANSFAYWFLMRLLNTILRKN